MELTNNHDRRIRGDYIFTYESKPALRNSFMLNVTFYSKKLLNGSTELKSVFMSST